jgi:hypothetical protein
MSANAIMIWTSYMWNSVQEKWFKYRIPPIVKSIPSQENFKVENSLQDEMFKCKFCSK